MSWPLVKLESIFEIARGGSPRPIADFITDDPEGLNWISIKDASNSDKYIARTKQKIKKEGLKKTRLVKPGDFLLTNSMSFGRPYIMKTTGCIHDGWLVLSGDSSKVDQDYFYHLLGSESLHNKFSRLAAGAVVKNLNISLVKGVEIPLPPLAEQQKIAAILDAADQLRQKDQKLIEHYTALGQSLFLKMFGDPVSNSRGWKIYKLSEVANSQLGKMLSKKSKQNINPKKYLRNANVRWRYFELQDILEMDFDSNETQKFNLENGDLLICEGGEVGRCAIWRDNLHDCYFQKALHRVRVNKNVLTPEYLQEYFFWMSKLGGLVSSVSEVTFSHLTGEKLQRLDIPLPPIEIQSRYAKRIQVIEQQKQQAEVSLKKSDALFNSLLQRAFKGELTQSDKAQPLSKAKDL